MSSFLTRETHPRQKDLDTGLDGLRSCGGTRQHHTPEEQQHPALVDVPDLFLLAA